MIYLIMSWYSGGISEVYTTTTTLGSAKQKALRLSMLNADVEYSVEGDEFPAGCWWNPVYRDGKQIQGVRES